MLDIKWIRDNQDAFLKGLTNRGFDDPQATLNRILSLDEQRRATIQKLQEAQARRNAASKEVGQAKAKKDEAAAKRLMDEVAALKGAIQTGEADEKRLDDELRNFARDHPEHAGSRRAGRRRCRSQCRNAQVRRAEEILVSAEAAFRDRRGARPHGFRDGRENLRRALRGAEGGAGAARTRARPVHARPAHERARLHRGRPAASRARRHHVRHRATAEVRRGSILGNCDQANGSQNSKSSEAPRRRLADNRCAEIRSEWHSP